MPQQYVVKRITRHEDWGDPEDVILTEPVVTITVTVKVDSGAEAVVSFEIPENWDTMTRAEKVAHGKSVVDAHLAGHNYLSAWQQDYPDPASPVTARLGWDADLPEWADWTPQQVEDWIRDNVHTQPNLLELNIKLAKAIIYLKDLVIYGE